MEQEWAVSSDPAPRRGEESPRQGKPHRHESLSLLACKALGIKFLKRAAGDNGPDSLWSLAEPSCVRGGLMYCKVRGTSFNRTESTSRFAAISTGSAFKAEEPNHNEA